MKACDRLLLLASPDQVVPLWNEIAERTSLVTERDSAIHASASLSLQLMELLVLIDLLPIADANIDWSAFRRLAISGQEAFWISHCLPPLRLSRHQDPRVLPGRWHQERDGNPAASPS